MTESEWSVSVDFQAMLRHLYTQRVSPRKWRLTHCALLRLRWDLLTDGRSRRAVEMAEQLADGPVNAEELRRALEDAGQAFQETLHTCYGERAVSFYTGRVKCALEACKALRGVSAVFVPPFRTEKFSFLELLPGEAWVLRDLHGTPVRRRRRPFAWPTPDVLALASGIYADRAFSRMPILADALEDAGCTEAALLDHLRRPATHFRGCWVLDAILGRK
jgi:hypothetical protein